MMVPAWEYRVEERRTTADVAWLNALGQEGWEAVQSLPLHDAMGNSLPQVGHIWLFKRMVLDHPSVLSSEQFVPEKGLEGWEEMKAQQPQVEGHLEGHFVAPRDPVVPTQEQPKRRHQMSEENRQKARVRMQAMVAAREANRRAVQEPEAQEADRELALPN